MSVRVIFYGYFLSLLCLETMYGQGFTCGDGFIDSRDGKYYLTVQIGNQCWMKNNLNIGNFVYGSINSYPNSDVQNNGIIEKYCFNNILTNCKNYGGLYDWNEAMDYTIQEGAQGICPTGWHIPTEAEWFILEQNIDSTIAVNTFGWNRGTDGGTKLKEFGASGFDALLGGYRNYDGEFGYLGLFGWFWTSSNSSGQYNFKRAVGANYSTIYRDGSITSYGFSVRCIYNNPILKEEIGNSNMKHLQIFPNPVKTHISFLIPVKHKYIEVEIFNILGKKVCEKNNYVEQVIDISFLTPGVYFLKVIIDNELYIEGFIKE